jgi:hypothetical protein
MGTHNEISTPNAVSQIRTVRSFEPVASWRLILAAASSPDPIVMAAQSVHGVGVGKSR